MFSYIAEHWQAFIVFGIIAVLGRLYYMRTGRYKKKKSDKGKGVFSRAAFSMATGIFMCYPAAYFILADIYKDYSEERRPPIPATMTTIPSPSTTCTRARATG